MKVLMIEHFSEGNKYTIELTDKLCDLVNLTVLTTNKSSMYGNDKFTVKKKLCGFSKENSVKKLLRYLYSIFYTTREVLMGKYDVVHIQTFRFYKIEIILYFILKPFIKRLIYTAHNILPHERSSMEKYFLKLAYKICDEIIVHNEVSKKVLMDTFYIKNKDIEVIPHGIYNSYDGKNRILNESSCEKKTLLFFGLIRKYKGVDVLLDAISKVPLEHRKNLKIKIMGNKFVDDDYEKFVMDNGLDDVIELDFRFIEDSEIPPIFDQAYATILPYKNIYGSGALLLSYTFDKPVIVSDIPAFVEETENGKTGLLFKNNDSSDLANKIVEILNKSKIEMQEYKDNIKLLIEKKYNWTSSAKMTMNVYREGE